MTDLDAEVHGLYEARMAHVRSHLARAEVDALLICDANDIFYATGAMNMQIFCARTPARYLLVIDGGPAILLEYRGCEHLAAGLSTINEIRLGVGLDIVSSGDDVAAASKELAREIEADLRRHGAKRLAVDRFPFSATDELRAAGLDLVPADTVLTGQRRLGGPGFRVQRVVIAKLGRLVRLPVTAESGPGLAHVDPVGEPRAPPLIVLRDGVELGQGEIDDLHRLSAVQYP